MVDRYADFSVKETLNKSFDRLSSTDFLRRASFDRLPSTGFLRQASFDRLRTNGKSLIPFVVSLSNHERNQLIQRFPKRFRA
jgi:hypothetical protein